MARRSRWLLALLLLTGACSSAGSVRPAVTGTSVTPATSTTLGREPALTTEPATTAKPPSTASATTLVATTTATPTTGKPPGPATTTAQSGGLTVTLSATRTGMSVSFVIDATESRARGALGYHLDYGDGSSDQNAVPQFCTAGPGSPQSQRWSLTHRYAAAGAYRTSVTVSANCTPDRATATVTVTV